MKNLFHPVHMGMKIRPIHCEEQWQQKMPNSFPDYFCEAYLGKSRSADFKRHKTLRYVCNA